ncbi:MAG: hypothetical protein Fur005_32600 [Roseiflexaceae bacterium]
MRQRQYAVMDTRPATSGLHWLALHAPDLAREVRAGQFVMLRCRDSFAEGSSEPYLRRALFVAAAEPQLGQVGLIFAPDADLGLRWLAHARVGDVVDLLGPFGKPLAIDPRTRTLLLIGQGDRLPALLLAAAEVLQRGCSATLLASAADSDLLPPAFLLPGDLEYQGEVGQAITLLQRSEGRAALPWADQIIAALPPDQLSDLRQVVQSVRICTDRGLVLVIPEVPLACGIGVCGTCSLPFRKGQRRVCHDGPSFDLRDLP